MDDTAQVRGVHGPRECFDQFGGRSRRLGFAAQHPVQAAAVNVLQRQKGTVVVFADFVDLDDVGMLQTGDGLRLDQEAARSVGPA